MQIERRIFETGIEVRARDEGGATVRGHAAVFDSLSENLGGFREQIRPGAFDDVLQDDVRALFNHDPNHILARTKSGTLSLGVDERGLTYEFDSPDTTTGRDLLVSMQRGDVSQSSFGFIVEDDQWDEDDEGRIVRTILSFKRLYDVSPVTFPAYPDTDVAKRSMGDWQKDLQAAQDERAAGDLYRYKQKLVDIGRRHMSLDS